MIQIRGWHGRLSKVKSEKMNSIATTVVETDYKWTFDGSIGEFAEKWNLPFVSYPALECPVIGRFM
jgi:hypothetical protein